MISYIHNRIEDRLMDEEDGDERIESGYVVRIGGWSVLEILVGLIVGIEWGGARRVGSIRARASIGPRSCSSRVINLDITSSSIDPDFDFVRDPYRWWSAWRSWDDYTTGDWVIKVVCISHSFISDFTDVQFWMVCWSFSSIDDKMDKYIFIQVFKKKKKKSSNVQGSARGVCMWSGRQPRWYLYRYGYMGQRLTLIENISRALRVRRDVQLDFNWIVRVLFCFVCPSEGSIGWCKSMRPLKGKYHQNDLEGS